MCKKFFQETKKSKYFMMMLAISYNFRKSDMPRPATGLLHRNFLSWPRNFRIYITFYAEFE